MAAMGAVQHLVALPLVVAVAEPQTAQMGVQAALAVVAALMAVSDGVLAAPALQGRAMLAVPDTYTLAVAEAEPVR